MRRQPGYHFASEAQWATCLLVGADRAGYQGTVALRPFTAFLPQSNQPSFGGEAFAPASTFTAEILWRDGGGVLYRVSPGGKQADATPAPRAIAKASRIVTSRDALWVAGDGDTLQCFDVETLSRRFVVEMAAPIVDVASDGRGGVRVLMARANAWHVVPVDGVGTIGMGVLLDAIPEPKAFTYLRGTGRMVVLSRDGSHVFAFPPEGGHPDTRLTAAALGSCFVGSLVASDPRGRVFIAGIDHADEPKPHVVVLDAFAVKLDDVLLREPATGLAASRDALVVTGSRGLDILRAADPVPESAADIGTMLITPMLVAPETTTGRRWLRIEAAGTLPPGSSLEFAYGSTDDPEERDDVLALANDSSIPAPKRAQALRSKGDFWSTPVTFHGRERLPNEGEATVAVPLHDVHRQYLWVAVRLTAGAGAKLPALRLLSVLYPGSTLMERLPAIYQRDEAQPESFIRTLVGILETTTQDLDARIAYMGRYIHPDHASEKWLDYLARWLGVPWDDALDAKQKRCIVQHGPEIARGRGTRTGLETLLDCLVGGKPRRFRIIDGIVDYGLARVGGDECEGSALPAILGGLPATAARLDVQATLGSMRLPCPDGAEEDAVSRFLGRLRVDVAATGPERQRWQPWLARLVAEMLPVGARASVRWTTASGLRGNRLDDSLTLDADHPARLDTDAITGVARLPLGGSTLPASSNSDGPILE